MKLKLITPEKLVLEREVISATLPGAVGQFTVLDGHDLLVAMLKSGPMYFRYIDADQKEKRTDLTIGDGIAEITGKSVKVFTSSTTF